MQPFHHLLINNLVANITNFTVWFAITFWIFLETLSVFATGMIAGIYLVLTGALGIWFGSLVDHHRKRSMMLVSSLVSLAIYAAALGAYALDPSIAAARVSSVSLWLFVLLTMLGVIVGNIRMIALPTLVTLLVPEDRRDKANGLVGMVSGIGFLTTSAISGFLIACGGMVATLAFAITFSLIAALHLLLVSVDEPREASEHDKPRRIDLIGTFRIVTAIPGLFALILFAAFNNLLGGVFMALMDAYGLSLMKVEQWGLLWAFVSCAFILSGALIARTGLGANPVRTLLLVNLIVWAVAALFTVQSSILLLTVGCFIWLFLGPYAEAAEQTTLQKVVPFERQGRVFGFAQSVEQAASPLTAFLIAPLTQFIFVPLMTSGAGADLIGDWYGRGAERGIAIVFTITGILGVIATLAAFRSQSYRRISAAYAAGGTGADTPTPPQ
ncbi:MULTISPECIES: MFS transporter [unclassified Sphingopyxis]|uniref:MFS transporter n=1 Tax=unclassified Sphingopyxis TaxID=2614943 RepID=UPI0028649B24|nr:MULTISPECIES: MFS transporter [unclassified Sphingopyxis]MDR6831776.1 DHA3 family multidrug efflux protein-like MFS transporter [Sphingopyxis sp. BE122]MDR7227518.1 DHA3 family multidrug efflux protein-like MFS transporter [Sphingopyxis sp. BE259]